ncbi:MAG: outer membrane protein transport protein [Melioribacteraceae bacterium]|nr:outer membrane protein transport protein [Melioribacteraceae bacterium]MCF8265667.1 outer membrane protein transport protein [Melioribacteraceae bacterium]MCF8414481.1 outer membrane protein transport protein [Melioribacteraceae bacterium]
MYYKNFIKILIGLILTSNLFGGTPLSKSASSARYLSLNGLFIAGYDGVNSLRINPAGLAKLSGKGFEYSLFGMLSQREYVKPGAILHKSFRDEDISYSLGAYWNLSENIVLALDYSNSIDYKINWPFAVYIAGDSSSAILAFDHMNEYSTTSINPAIAIQFGEFSIGFTLNAINIKHMLAFYQGNKNWEASETGIAAYQLRTEAEAWAFGGTLGIQGSINEKLKFGVFVKSAITTTLEGNSESRLFADLDSTDSISDVSTDFESPWVLGAGIIYELNENLNLNVDAVYKLWGSTQASQSYNYSNQLWENRLSGVDSLSGYKGTDIPLNYDNAFEFGVGLEYDTKSNLVLRIGYKYSQSKNTVATYNFLNPSVDEHSLSLGIGFWFEDLYTDLGIVYNRGIEKEISENENYFFPGRFSGDSYVPSLNIRYQF